MSEYLKQSIDRPERREPTIEEMALDKLVQDADGWLFECPALDAIAKEDTARGGGSYESKRRVL